MERAGDLLTGAARLLQRYGAGIFVDIFALHAALTTLDALLRPARLRDPGGGSILSLFEPSYLLAESLFAVIAAAICLRIWRGETGEDAPTLGPRVPVLVLASVGISIFYYLGLSLLILPGLAVAALTWLVTPLIAIEARGFDAVGESARRSAPLLPALFGLSLLILVAVWVSVSAIYGWVLSDPDASAGTLWLRWVAADLLWSALGTAAIAVTMSLYLLLPRPRGIDDVFR